jgi:hypothetical protein
VSEEKIISFWSGVGINTCHARVIISTRSSSTNQKLECEIFDQSAAIICFYLRFQAKEIFGKWCLLIHFLALCLSCSTLIALSFNFINIMSLSKEQISKFSVTPFVFELVGSYLQQLYLNPIRTESITK